MREDAFDRIPETALDWHRSSRGAALATVVETWGSAPRAAGSQLAISGAGEIAGSVSGGCVEGAVVVEALEALDDGRPRIASYGVSDGDAFAVGLTCGGRIRVMIEPVGTAAGLPADLLSDLVAARSARRPVALVTDTRTWSRRLEGPEHAALAERFRADRSGFDETGTVFAAIHNAPLRLVVVGAVHIAQPLLRMAAICGFDVTLIDPRESFASAARFPEVTLLTDWPDAALAAHGLDARTAVVTLTHDSKLDDPALIAALGSDVFYTGCLGSPRTHARRVERLTEAGIGPEQIARLHGPVGLDIGARTPTEIAVSILAEIVAVLRRGA